MGYWKKISNRLLGYESSREFAVPQNSTIVLTHDSGFFSNRSVLLKALAASPVHPVTIDAAKSFRHFTNKGEYFDWYRFFVQRLLPSMPNLVPGNSAGLLLASHTTPSIDFWTIGPQMPSS